MFREDHGELRARKLKRALVSCILTFIWLAVLVIGAMAVGTPRVARAFGAGNQGQRSLTLPNATPQGSPLATPTVTETETPTPAVTRTPSPTRAPTQSSNTPGPQPTRVTFSQPTVGASASFDSPGITGAASGPNGLVIVTITSCITAILALITTAVSFSALRRGGYAPFLRTLLLGARAGKRGRSRGGTARGRNGGRRALGSSDDEVHGYYARDASGRSRDYR